MGTGQWYDKIYLKIYKADRDDQAKTIPDVAVGRHSRTRTHQEFMTLWLEHLGQSPVQRENGHNGRSSQKG